MALTSSRRNVRGRVCTFRAIHSDLDSNGFKCRNPPRKRQGLSTCHPWCCRHQNDFTCIFFLTRVPERDKFQTALCSKANRVLVSILLRRQSCRRPVGRTGDESACFEPDRLPRSSWSGKPPSGERPTPSAPANANSCNCHARAVQPQCFDFRCLSGLHSGLCCCTCKLGLASTDYAMPFSESGES